MPEQRIQDDLKEHVNTQWGQGRASVDLSLEEHGGLTVTLYTCIYFIFAKVLQLTMLENICKTFYIYTLSLMLTHSLLNCGVLHPGCTLASGTKNRLV